MPTALDVLEKTPYALLTTFKRDGTAVATPVWVVRDGEELLVWTGPEAGKVKRIRRNPEVLIVPCGQRGKPHGKPVAAQARILPPEQAPKVRPLLVQKYGWQARLSQVGQAIQKIRGREMPICTLAVSIPVA